MERNREILYMQVRLARFAARAWNLSLAETAQRFRECDVPTFIEQHYDLLHLEGDEAVLADVERFMRHAKGQSNAATC